MQMDFWDSVVFVKELQNFFDLCERLPHTVQILLHENPSLSKEIQGEKKKKHLWA